MLKVTFCVSHFGQLCNQWQRHYKSVVLTANISLGLKHIDDHESILALDKR